VPGLLGKKSLHSRPGWIIVTALHLIHFSYFNMIIVTWMRVHPYKATHFENRKSILHFTAFMVLHKVPIGLTKFVSKHWWPNDRFSNANKQHDCSLHYFVRSCCFRKIRQDSTGVMWLKIERLWYVKKSEVWKDDDNNNKYCTTVRIQTFCKLMYALNLKEASKIWGLYLQPFGRY